MIIAYRHATSIGPFFIRQWRGRWHVFFRDENLGGYLSPHQAADDLAGGHTDWPGFTDPSTLGISDDIGDWEPIHK
jgi:hypothetical protein